MVIAEEIVDVTSGLYRFMVRLEELVENGRQPTGESTDRLRDRARTLMERFAAVREHVGARMARTVDGIARSLRAMEAALGEERPRELRLRKQWRALGTHYEQMVAHIRRVQLTVPRDKQLEHLKPRNYTRNIFHMITGVVGITLYEFFLGREGTLLVGGSLLGLFVFLEILRSCSGRWNERLYGTAFARISRPSEEHKICTSTWYLSGLVIGVALLPKHAIELGTLVLAFGDPVASLVGKRWGRTKIWGDKSLVGTIAFVVVATVLCAAFITWRLPHVGLWAGVGAAAVVAVTGAITELFSRRLNDNLTIPLVAGLAAALLI